MNTRAENIYLLNRYFNMGCLSKWDQIFSSLNSRLPFYLNSSQIFRSTKNNIKEQIPTNEQTINISSYSGKNKSVIDTMNFLQTHLSNDLAAAFIHGSLGTGEEINYSDFDGLIILKNEVFHDRKRIQKVAMKINESYSFMIAMDPLQHHGWFVLTECDLQNWPCTFFPPELFKHSKSIFNGAQNLNLKYQNNKQQSLTSFKRITDSIIRKLSQDELPENTYQLKSLLSEFMLLPSLYLQAKNNRAVFKKFSFDEASSDFSKDEWEIMNAISLLRTNWPSVLSSLKINAPCKVTPQLRKKQIQLSHNIAEVPLLKFNNEMITKMFILVNSFKAKLI